MSDEYATPQMAIQSFKSDFKTLQDSLKPLFGAEWEETREKLGTLERAKMDIMLAYAINDLVWVYLKLRGIDPEEHQVTKALERIKDYYAKIRQIEQPQAQRTTRVDQGAAKRFVTAAIPKSQRRNGNQDLPSTSAAGLAAKQAREAEESMLDRVSMGQRMRFIEEKGDRMEDEGEGLDIVDGDDDEMDDEEADEMEEEDDGAEDLLREVEGEINRAREVSTGGSPPTQSRSSSAGARTKRKRAEDLA